MVNAMAARHALRPSTLVRRFVSGLVLGVTLVAPRLPLAAGPARADVKAQPELSAHASTVVPFARR